ncbi:hypothetical protein [Sulfuricurvum sp.]|uniref:hypothetical protein n=1 Tax=Sulfuricurvum sp. TaxID=2025608 RepID=UPI003BB7C35A
MKKEASNREEYIAQLISQYGPILMRENMCNILGLKEAQIKVCVRKENWTKLPKPFEGGRGVAYKWHASSVADFVFSHKQNNI